MHYDGTKENGDKGINGRTIIISRTIQMLSLSMYIYIVFIFLVKTTIFKVEKDNFVQSIDSSNVHRSEGKNKMQDA